MMITFKQTARRPFGHQIETSEHLGKSFSMWETQMPDAKPDGHYFAEVLVDDVVVATSGIAEHASNGMMRFHLRPPLRVQATAYGLRYFRLAEDGRVIHIRCE